MEPRAQPSTTPYIIATALTIGITALFGIPIAIASNFNSDYDYNFLYLAPFIAASYVVATMNIVVFSIRLRKKAVQKRTAFALIAVSSGYWGVVLWVIVTSL